MKFLSSSQFTKSFPRTGKNAMQVRAATKAGTAQGGRACVRTGVGVLGFLWLARLVLFTRKPTLSIFAQELNSISTYLATTRTLIRRRITLPEFLRIVQRSAYHRFAFCLRMNNPAFQVRYKDKISRRSLS